jgi:predicted acetyltransferase
MAPQFEYSSVSNPEDAQQLGTILDQCFNCPASSSQPYFNRIGVENFRILRKAGQIAGGLATLSMGQWFGNQCVPMTGIAAVGIAPEHRGTGAAIALMQHTLKELHVKGVPISVLYPATQRLYRKAGYEQGGSFCGWEISTESIQLKENSLSLQPVAAIDDPVFHSLARQQAKLTNGHLDRNQAIWQGIFKPDDKETVYSYLIGSADHPQGYIIFSQHQTEDGSFLRIRDWAVLTTAAARSLWTFVAAHRSQIQKVRWRGAVVDPLTLLLPEQTAKIRTLQRWMLRVIDVTKALEKRGYPLGVQTELHLEVQDNLLLENNGKFILSVSKGRGEVTPGGKGELKLEVGGLAPLYTGLFTPHQLQLAGQLDATETALLAATQLFAGASPWMPDFF